MSHSRPKMPSAEELAALPSDGGAGWNRLVFEKSPYLLQHAANPVDWWPWGDAAFEAARAQNKPVFLSIGYSTCHWCHVMEHESFDDEETAALLNGHFIPIKVDREERPDIDQVYMTVTIAYTGQGGWPMTVLLTPDRKPFFAGTYFPRDGRHGRPGMKELVPYFAELWKSDRDKVQGAADELTGELARMTTSFPGGELGAATLDLAFEQLEERFDEVFGGFSGRHKFPTPHNFIFLVRYWERTGNARALEIVTKTLRAMRLGGIFDQVGFGFHRYSTDERWLLPHFEKMLYDQALMVLALVEAHQATGDESLARTARETLTYVLRDMTAPEGGFYSAEDADSEGEEGKFTVWSAEEVDAVLGAEDGAFFRELFHFEEGGNFREESTGLKQGVNIPHLRATLEEEAAARGMAVGALRERVEAMRARLFEVREARIHPLKDDKILTDWNGLMIAAMARAGRALAAPEYTAAARRAADFVLTHLRTPEGRLLKRHRGEAGLPAHLDDYAFMVMGLVDLYEATFEVRFLREARALAETMLDLFHDGESGGFFLTARDGEALIVRPKESYDGAIPSGNSVAAYALLRLGRMTGEVRFEEVARGVLEAFSAPLEKAPSNFTFGLLALDFDLGPSEEIVLAGDLDAVAPMRALLDRAYLPRAVVLHRPGDVAGAQEVVDLVPFLEHQMPLNGGATAYLCRNYACESPVTDAGELARRLEARKSKAEREKGSST